eukprot:Selendium_serpulae@DN5834_c1_g1_i2.p1
MRLGAPCRRGGQRAVGVRETACLAMTSMRRSGPAPAFPSIDHTQVSQSQHQLCGFVSVVSHSAGPLSRCASLDKSMSCSVNARHCAGRRVHLPRCSSTPPTTNTAIAANGCIMCAANPPELRRMTGKPRMEPADAEPVCPKPCERLQAVRTSVFCYISQ